jgi:hypothetical protein
MLNRRALILTAEELQSNKDEVELLAHHVDKKDFCGKSNPFLVISKSTESGDYVVVHKTEAIKNTLWK